MEYSGTFFVNTHSDDDIIGIVFGYQGPKKFFVASWKKSRQIYWDTRPFRAKADSAFNIKVTWRDCPVLITSIRRENKLGYFYLDVICSEKGTVLRESKFSDENLIENYELWRTAYVEGQT